MRKISRSPLNKLLYKKWRGFYGNTLNWTTGLCGTKRANAQLSEFARNFGASNWKGSMREKIGWDAYFLGVAGSVSLRSSCVRRRVGALVVNRRRRIRGAGYNDAPPGMPGCEVCPRRTSDVPPGSSYDTGAGACVALHAEQNALLDAGRECIDATLYVTTEPCEGCLKLIRAAGIIRVKWPQGQWFP